MTTDGDRVNSLEEYVSLPDCVCFKKSGVNPSHIGIWCSNEVIAKGELFGPLIGEDIESISDEINLRYLLEVIDPDTQKRTNYLHATDIKQRNWPWYVNSVRKLGEHNLASIQEGDKIMYKAIKDIDPGQELLICFEKNVENKRQHLVGTDLLEEDQMPPIQEDFSSPTVTKISGTLQNGRNVTFGLTSEKNNLSGSLDSDVASIKQENSHRGPCIKTKAELSTDVTGGKDNTAKLHTHEEVPGTVPSADTTITADNADNTDIDRKNNTPVNIYDGSRTEENVLTEPNHESPSSINSSQRTDKLVQNDIPGHVSYLTEWDITRGAGEGIPEFKIESISSDVIHLTGQKVLQQDCGRGEQCQDNDLNVNKTASSEKGDLECERVKSSDMADDDESILDCKGENLPSTGSKYTNSDIFNGNGFFSQIKDVPALILKCPGKELEGRPRCEDAVLPGQKQKVLKSNMSESGLCLELSVYGEDDPRIRESSASYKEDEVDVRNPTSASNTHNDNKTAPDKDVDASRLSETTIDYEVRKTANCDVVNHLKTNIPVVESEASLGEEIEPTRNVPSIKGSDIVEVETIKPNVIQTDVNSAANDSSSNSSNLDPSIPGENGTTSVLDLESTSDVIVPEDSVCLPASIKSTSSTDGMWFQFEIKPEHVLTGRLGRELYKCNICDAIYRHAFSLKRHFTRTHINHMYINRTMAELCNMKLHAIIPVASPSKDARKVDPDLQMPDLYRCNLCCAFFNEIDDVRTHMSDHPAGTKKVYSCNKCDMKFSRNQNLMRHFAVHSGTGKSFCCQQCGTSFPNATAFKQHEESHGQAARYECKKCTMTFVQRLGLIQHLRKEHSFTSTMTLRRKTPEAVVRKKYRPIQVSPRVTRKSVTRSQSVFTSAFSCVVCKKKFENFWSLCKHRQKFHAEHAQSLMTQHRFPLLADGNVSQVIADNLCYFIDGKKDAIERSSNLIRRYEGHDSPDVSSEPVKIDWKTYNFPKGFKPADIFTNVYMNQENLVENKVATNKVGCHNRSHICPVCRLVFYEADAYKSHIIRDHAIRGEAASGLNTNEDTCSSTSTNDNVSPSSCVNTEYSPTKDEDTSYVPAKNEQPNERVDVFETKGLELNKGSKRTPKKTPKKKKVPTATLR